MVMCMPKLGAYFIDLPRAIRKDKLSGLFSGIETIKGGFAYDPRYEFKSEDFDSPYICVFSNIVPDLSMLSLDRWNIWTINDKHELVKFTTELSLATPIAPQTDDQRDG